MNRPSSKPNADSADALARILDDFEYPIEPDDFILYELNGLIDEDRASFEDEIFRRLIDEGISEHAEERADVRSAIAMRLRRTLPGLDEGTKRIAERTIRTLEDMDAPLTNVSLIVRTYTASLFRRLEEPDAEAEALEKEAVVWIDHWQDGTILREQMTTALKKIGRPAVGPLADLLFDAPDDRMAAEAAIEILGAIPCSSSARVLTHTIAEPILAEDLEARAYAHARKLWPRQRHYMLYTLAPHDHEDISFRWYELLIDCGELYAVDRILDEVWTHAEEPEYREDLSALLELLRRAGDPDTEEKIVGMLNASDAPIGVREILEGFLSGFRPIPPAAENPWARAARQADLNKRYRAAAKLHDSGRTKEALSGLEAILKDDPAYSFALGLKGLMS